MSTVHQYHCAVSVNTHSIQRGQCGIDCHDWLISAHQKLPATHCVVIVVLQRVSGTYVQSQCQGVVAKDQQLIIVSDTHVQHKLPSSTSL